MTDLDGSAFIRRGETLVPAEINAEAFLHSVPEGREVLVSIRRARSVPQHRLMFALLRRVCENSDQWASENELLDAVKLAVGHVELRLTLDGRGYRAPKSISFASMKQDAFQRFFDRAVYVLSKMIGVTPDELLA